MPATAAPAAYHAACIAPVASLDSAPLSMRKFTFILLLLGTIAASLSIAPAAAPVRDASDLFLRAYMHIQEGDAARDRSDWKTAEARYQDAMNILKDIEIVQPDWNPHIISFRKRYCEQHINDARARSSAPAVAPAPPQAAPAAAPVVQFTPTPESNVVRQLSSEVDRLRQEVQRMQNERAAAIVAPPPAPMPVPAAASPDAERARQLEADLNDARRQIQQLLAEKSQAAPPLPMATGDALRVRELTDQMTTLRSQLQQMLAERAEWEQARQELARLQTERASLLRQLQEKDMRLAAGPAALEQAQAAVKITPEQMAQHARALEALRGENKQLSIKLASAERDARVTGEKAAQVGPLQEQLAATKAEIEKIKQQLASTSQNLAAKTQEAETAQTQAKEAARLEKANNDLRLELSKSQALLASTTVNSKDAAAQIQQLKTQLQEAKGELTQAKDRTATLERQAKETLAQLEGLRRELTETSNRAASNEVQRLNLARENATLRASLDRQAADAGQRAATGAMQDRDRAQEAEKLRQQLADAEKLAATRENERLTLAKENAVLRALIEQKTADYQKQLKGGGTDRERVAALEKTLREAEKRLAILELPRPKLSPAEEEFLKKTEVLVHPPAEKGLSGEISANVRRAKERALADVAGRSGAPKVSPAPKAILAQADTTGSNVVSDAPRGATVPKLTTISPEPAKPTPAAMAPDLKALVDEARDLYNKKNYDAAAAKYREVLKRDPENLFGLSNLAVIRFQQDRLEEAEHLLRRALQVAPEDAYSHSMIGIIYYRQHKSDEAIDALTKAAKLNPDNAEAHNYLGIACWQKGWRSAAEQELRRALEIRPDYADAHYNLAVVYATQKPPFIGLAKFHYRKTVELGRARDPVLEKILSGEK